MGKKIQNKLKVIDQKMDDIGTVQLMPILDGRHNFSKNKISAKSNK